MNTQNRTQTENRTTSIKQKTLLELKALPDEDLEQDNEQYLPCVYCDGWEANGDSCECPVCGRWILEAEVSGER